MAYVFVFGTSCENNQSVTFIPSAKIQPRNSTTLQEIITNLTSRKAVECYVWPSSADRRLLRLTWDIVTNLPNYENNIICRYIDTIKQSYCKSNIFRFYVASDYNQSIGIYVHPRGTVCLTSGSNVTIESVCYIWNFILLLDFKTKK